MRTPATLTLIFALLLFAPAALTGCRSAPVASPTTEPADAGAEPSPLAADPRGVRAFHGTTGLPLSWDSLVAQCAAADAVLIGEMHGHRLGLDFAEALYADVLARRPNTACLSMEFFSRDHQVALDDYVAGITDEEAFRRASLRGESNYPGAHRSMVEASRAEGRPVVAANAPRRYVRLSRTEGFDALRALNERQRALVEIPGTLTRGAYRERFYELMSGMSSHMDESAGDPVLPFYRAQNVWDETMADSIADGIESGCAPIVHVVGKFHIDESGGLVTRLGEKAPSARVLTITTVDAWSDGLNEDHEERADIVVYVGPPRPAARGM